MGLVFNDYKRRASGSPGTPLGPHSLSENTGKGGGTRPGGNTRNAGNPELD